jgi:hypothetical protein
MGFVKRRFEEKREVAKARAWADSAHRQLFDEAGAFEDVYARRVAKIAAAPAVFVAGRLLMSNSQVAIPAGQDEHRVRDQVVRRAQWSIGLVQVRLVAPEYAAFDIVDACVDELRARAPMLAADVARLWDQGVRETHLPEPGESFDVLLDSPWIRTLAGWIIEGLEQRHPETPERAVTAASLHLVGGCRESVAQYGGASG